MIPRRFRIDAESPGDLLCLLYREGCVERVAGREHGVAGSLTRSSKLH